MAYEVEKTPIEVKSLDGVSVVRGFTWKPVGLASVNGVVQLVHGMAEYIDRYDEFARFLASNGYVVCGHDHIGHGMTQPNQELRGCLPLNGAEIMIKDANAVRAMVVADYPTVPVFLFGHSMGSFVARAITARWGKKELAGVVICGTGFVPTVMSSFGLILARLIARTKGINAKSPLLHFLADGAYSKAIPNARTPFDWLNTDARKVDEYIADPGCGFMFGAGGYASLMALLQEVCSRSHFEDVSVYTRALYVAGDKDPVGSNGEGVWEAANRIKKGGCQDVKVVLYPGMRHEILNERGFEEVYADILNWLSNVDKR